MYATDGDFTTAKAETQYFKEPTKMIAISYFVILRETVF